MIFNCHDFVLAGIVQDGTCCWNCHDDEYEDLIEKYWLERDSYAVICCRVNEKIGLNERLTDEDFERLKSVKF